MYVAENNVYPELNVNIPKNVNKYGIHLFIYFYFDKTMASFRLAEEAASRANLVDASSFSGPAQNPTSEIDICTRWGPTCPAI